MTTTPAVHPGAILRAQFMEPQGLSASGLAIRLHVPAPRVNDIVRERRGISPDSALRLARYFGTAPQYWMDLQTAYDLRVAAVRPERCSAESVSVPSADLPAARRSSAGSTPWSTALRIR